MTSKLHTIIQSFQTSLLVLSGIGCTEVSDHLSAMKVMVILTIDDDG